MYDLNYCQTLNTALDKLGKKEDCSWCRDKRNNTISLACSINPVLFYLFEQGMICVHVHTHSGLDKSVHVYTHIQA